MYQLKSDGQGAQGGEMLSPGKSPNKVDTSTRMEWARSPMGWDASTTMKQARGPMGWDAHTRMKWARSPMGWNATTKDVGCVLCLPTWISENNHLNWSDYYPNTRVGSCNFAVLMKSDQVREDTS